MAKPNVLTRSRKSKATELFRANRLLEADALYAAVSKADGTDTEAWVMRGVIHRKLGQFEEAEIFCRRALVIKPGLATAHHALGAAVQCQGRMDEAIISYRRAILLQPNFADAHYFLANALREAGAMNEAVASYRRAIELEPDFVEALSNLGAALTLMGQTQEATSILNKAIVLRPNAPQILCIQGSILQLQGRLAEALEKFQRALRLNPDSLDAISNVGTLLEKTSRLEEAAELVKRELLRAPDSPALLLVAAKLERRAGRTEEAIELLEKALKQKLGADLAGEIHLQLGQLCDRNGEAERAFVHFIKGNHFVAQITGSANGAQNKYLNKIKRMRDYLVPELAALPLPTPPIGEISPVFLLGFPRSGTTLLEQILDSHPNLQALEEKGTVAAMERAFEEMAQGRENALAELTQAQVSQLKNIYFEEAARYLELSPGNLMVDKMPLNTISVHLIWRVFPRAKFILAIRHPCDVCLSSFMQFFITNEAMASFFTLESGALVYSEVMRTWIEAISLLPLDYHRIRYEDLVVNFEHETRALLNFLGVGWDDRVLGHVEHAKKRGTINTPSYHQVTQPIYQHAKYRWKRYTKQFEPVIQRLQPYIDYFGYTN